MHERNGKVFRLGLAVFLCTKPRQGFIENEYSQGITTNHLKCNTTTKHNF
jgi:hypothetical protein